MKKIVLSTLLLLHFLTSFSQIGGSGKCIVGGNPNNITALEDMDARYNCMTVYDTVDNQHYKYIHDLALGTRWVVYPYVKPYQTEWIDKDALTVQDTFDCSAEVGPQNDFGIIPKILQHPITGDLYVQFRTSATHLQGPTMLCHFRKSTDGGTTWTGLDGTGTFTTITDPFGANEMDCSGAAFTPTGRLILFVREFNGSSYVENHHMWSDDGGITWSAPVITGAGQQIGYMYDYRFVQGEDGELIYGQRTINDGVGNTRYIRYYHSYDNGETWEQRSIALDNSDKGWNFGEVITRDLGGGLFISFNRLVALNDDGLNLPFFMISRDYGRNWAGTNETLFFQDIQDGLYESSFVELEGAGVTLGGSSANESVLPTMEVIHKDDQTYLLLAYYIRAASIDQDSWRATIIRVDDWLGAGNASINPTIFDEFFQGDAGGINTPDGNGSLWFPKGRRAGLWITADNTGNGSNGPSIIIMGQISETLVDDLINDLDN